MEYFHYVNIFETKGLEYILVICFMITFVFFVRKLSGPPGGSLKNGNQLPPSADGLLVVPPEDKKHKE